MQSTTFSLLLAALLAFPAAISAASGPGDLPAKTDPDHGQFGYNDCQKRYPTKAAAAKGHCQNVFLNSVTDFCLFAPHSPHTIGDQEAKTIAYCMKSGYGTRLIPDGTIKGAHFLKTPSFVQVTGNLHGTKINIKDKDEGGELDPHGADGSGNPVGGTVWTNAFTGKYERIYEWQNFMAYNEFCFRGCIGEHATQYCPHIYDLMGCYWNEPANYDNNVFENCVGTSGEYPGVYHGSTWYQGQSPTPGPQKAGKSSKCKSYKTISTGVAKDIPSTPKGKRAAAMQTGFAGQARMDWDDEE